MPAWSLVFTSTVWDASSTSRSPILRYTILYIISYARESSGLVMPGCGLPVGAHVVCVGPHAELGVIVKLSKLTATKLKSVPVVRSGGVRSLRNGYALPRAQCATGQGVLG